VSDHVIVGRHVRPLHLVQPGSDVAEVGDLVRIVGAAVGGGTDGITWTVKSNSFENLRNSAQRHFAWYTHKTSGFKTSGFKTSGFKTSGFKTSGIQNVRFTKRQVSRRLVSKRPVFKFDILVKQKV
jgi:hypothetical protein